MLLQLYKRFGAHTRKWQEAMEERQKNKKKTRMSFAQPRPEKELAYAQALRWSKQDPATKSNGRTAAPKPGLASTHKFRHDFWHGNLPGCTVAPKKIETFFEDFTISKMEVEFWNNTRSFGCENT